jgi:hypothetical protein
MDKLFSLFRQIWKNLAALAGYRHQIFFSARLTFFTFLYLAIIEQPQEEPPPPQANQRCCRHSCRCLAALKQFCRRRFADASLPTEPLPRRHCCHSAAAAALLPLLLPPQPPLLRCPHQRPIATANVKSVALF